MKELDKKENEAMPDAQVSSNNVIFKDVRYPVLILILYLIFMTFVHIWCQLQQILQLKIQDKCLRDSASSRSWTKESSASHGCGFLLLLVLLLQRKRSPLLLLFVSFYVLFKLYVLFLTKQDVDNNTVHALNGGREKLEDILILHLENGKDYFISVSGKYLVSAFGNSLEFLVRTPNPVRTGLPVFAQPNPSLSARNPAPPTPLPANETDQRLSIPKELWRMIDYIYKKGMREVLV